MNTERLLISVNDTSMDVGNSLTRVIVGREKAVRVARRGSRDDKKVNVEIANSPHFSWPEGPMYGYAKDTIAEVAIAKALYQAEHEDFQMETDDLRVIPRPIGNIALKQMLDEAAEFSLYKSEKTGRITGFIVSPVVGMSEDVNMPDEYDNGLDALAGLVDYYESLREII